MIAILVGAVVLYFDLHFPDTVDAEQLSGAYWPFVYLPWRNSYSHLLLILKYLCFIIQSH